MTENPDFQTDPATGQSIDDALEAARGTDPDQPMPDGALGLGVDVTRKAGQDDATAAEQGNRDQDEMRAENGDPADPDADAPLN